MAHNDLDSVIRSRIEAFLAELTALVRQAALESVREALGGGAPALRHGPGRPRKAGAERGARSAPGGRGKRVKRTAADMEGLTQRILEHVRKHPGQGASQIGTALRLSTKELQLPVRKLLASRKLKTTGRKRSTKYFPR